MKKKKRITNIIFVFGMLCLILTACRNKSNDINPLYMQPEMKGEIIVSVYQSEEWMEMAVQMFEEKYPGVKVQVEPFYTGRDSVVVEGSGSTLVDRPAGQTKEDYATWLNAQLMSGSAGDIVGTSDGLAIQKYENMGVFEDLSLYLEGAAEINDESCYMNIFESYRTETGELYQFPVSAMACPLFMFNAEIVQETGNLSKIKGKSLTWREALTLAEEMYDASDMPGRCLPEARAILGNIFTKTVVDSVDYDNNKVKLQETELLEILGAFEEFNYYNTYMGAEETGDFKVMGLEYTPDTTAAGVLVMSGEYIAAQWKQADGKVHLSPYFARDFGINSQSKNKALAWEFLRFLLSDEVQTLPSFPYAGINKKGLRERVEAYCDADNLQGQSDEMLKMISDWLTQINGYRMEDTDLIQIGDAILMDFMDGSLTAEETVREAKFRLEQYLSE